MRHILLLISISLGVYASIPRSLSYDTTVGPDGPWNALTQTVSWPQQNITLLPSLTKTNLFVHSDACSNPISACPQSQTSLWAGLSGTWSWMNSNPFSASTWDTSLGPLNLSGQASYISDRITLQSTGQHDSYLDFTANAIDQSINVNYPSQSAWYTLDTGFFSLYGAQAHVEYTSVNGSDVSLNTTLPLAYVQDAIPSAFYGLHIGSALTSSSIPGSLVLGGYDKARCLTTPIVSNTDTFELIDVGLGVASGDSPFQSDEQLPIHNLLRTSGVSTFKAYPNPGVPYLYLPYETCATIAKYLPIDFNETLGLYIWNTSVPSYQDIMTSPSYLSFNFSSGTSTSTIYLPFALLNLTLEWPLVSFPTQYFPCSPYQSPDGRFHLGRAFLQGAFMAQNWQTGKLMLAQAPGPDMADSSLATISPNDTSTVSPMIKAPSWDSTWASKLTPFQRNETKVSEPTDDVTTRHDDLSPGATAGIVIGTVAVLVLIAGVCWAWVRRQKMKVAQADDEKISSRGMVEICETGSAASSSLPSEIWAPGKHGLTLDPIELDAAALNELHADLLLGLCASVSLTLFLSSNSHNTSSYVKMEYRESKAAQHAAFVHDQLFKADALYDEGAHGDCLALLFDLIENYNMSPLPRMKTLVMLCALDDDWEYAEACRLEAEDVWHHCDKHPEEGYDKAVLAKFRGSLDSLLEDMTMDPAKTVSEMVDEEIDYRMRLMGDGSVKAPPGSQSHMTFEERVDMFHTAQRGALEEYYTTSRSGDRPDSQQQRQTHSHTQAAHEG
ncbi:hypothetical protein QM012_005999 [Aureobasidium pullulans]|uniref:Peptidase A1 domain-containing protein n=1 Tax=Aureobasidium pullulans TaxID=5580 RepID=A0ABR0TRC0_AURPU